MTSLFAGELRKGGREIDLAPGFKGICTFASKCPSLLSRPNEIWLSFRIHSSRYLLIRGSSRLMSNFSTRWLLLMVAAPLFNLLRKDTRWEWTDLHTEAFELCKQVLTNVPVRGYAIPGSPYQLYSDACDFGLAPLSTNSATQFPNWSFQGQRFQPQKAHVNMIGWTPSLEPPKFPKDDKNISPRKTPESVNARLCRHCRSRKHWDYECKHSCRGER